MKSNKLFNCFNLKTLEGLTVLTNASIMNTEDFLKQDLSLLDEDKLISVLAKKECFQAYEKELIRFWASLFKSKKLFEIGIDKKMNERDFNVVLKNFIVSEDFKDIFKDIQWAYMFVEFNNLVLDGAMRFYENVAIALSRNGSLTIELAKKFDSMAIDWDYRDVEDGTVFMYLFDYKPQLDLINYLLSKNVNVNNANVNGWTGLMGLCCHKTVTLDILKLLLDNGVDVNYRPDDSDSFKDLCANESVTLEMIQLFLDKCDKVDFQDYQGKTTLMYLCRNKVVTIDMIKLLLDKGADISIQNNFDETALSLYIEFGGEDYEILKLLGQD